MSLARAPQLTSSAGGAGPEVRGKSNWAKIGGGLPRGVCRRLRDVQSLPSWKDHEKKIDDCALQWKFACPARLDWAVLARSPAPPLMTVRQLPWSAKTPLPPRKLARPSLQRTIDFARCATAPDASRTPLPSDGLPSSRHTATAELGAKPHNPRLREAAELRTAITPSYLL